MAVLLKIVLCFGMLLGLVSGKLLHFHQTYPTYGQDNEVQYDFGYAIDDLMGSGIVTDRWEERKGGRVKGSYSLLEPGGRIRTVDYTVDGGGGFQAVVKTMLPGQYFLSRQEFLKSVDKHPQPSPELEIPTVIGNSVGPSKPIEDEDEEERPPVNYHAINAQLIGFQRLFGGGGNRRRGQRLARRRNQDRRPISSIPLHRL